MSPIPSLSDVLLRTQTDERLARLVADGDHRAFAMLVHRHRTQLARVAARVVGPHRSEDVVQQALLGAWVSLAAGKEVRNVQAWLYQILRNAAYTEYARGESTTPIPDDAADRDSSEAVEQRLIVRELVQRMGDLPEHQRVALVETELEGRSRHQIATDMGVSDGAVRQLVHRARTALRVAMTAVMPYPLVVWASRHSGGSRLAGLSSIGEDAAGRSAGLAESAASGAAAGGALAVKGGVALLAAGAIGSLGWQSLTSHHAHHRRHAPPARLAGDRRGVNDLSAGIRGAAGAGPIGSVRSSMVPLAMLVREGAPAAPGTGRVGDPRNGGSDAARSESGQSSRPEDGGSSVGSGDRTERSGGGTPSSDGGSSGESGPSPPSSGSTSRGSDGESFSSPPALSTASSTTAGGGGGRDSSRDAPATSLPGSDN